MKPLGERALMFLLGYFIYSLIEILARGYTHWTMAVVGGTVLIFMYDVNLRFEAPLWQRCLLGALFITAMEFTVGVIDNLVLRWGVWDYTTVPLNVLGQICLPFIGALKAENAQLPRGGWFPESRYLTGLHEVSATYQYVSTGLGTTYGGLLNFRLWNPPQISIITLTRQVEA